MSKEAEWKILGCISTDCDEDDDFMPTDEEMPYVHIIKCCKCGWRMFGDNWKPTPYGMIGEQIPGYCGHCGAKFTVEAGAENEL